MEPYGVHPILWRKFYLQNVPFRRQFQIEKSFYELFIGFVTALGIVGVTASNYLFSVILKADSLGLETVLEKYVDLTGRFSDGMEHGFNVVFVLSETT